MPESDKSGILAKLRNIFSRGTDSGEINPDPTEQPAPGDDVSGNFATGLPFAIYSDDVNNISEKLKIDNDLISRYIDYENMDDEPIISAAYDIYADDATQTDAMNGHVMWVETNDVKIKKEIDRLLYKILNVDENAWEVARSLVKYGNNFERIMVSKNGVIGTDFVSPSVIRRFEQNGKFAFVYNSAGEFRLSDDMVFSAIKNGSPLVKGKQKYSVFEDWSISHFRIRNKNRGALYGFSVADSARWAWKRLSLLEDASVIYKITRTPSRFIYYINVGNMPPQQGYSFANKIKQQARKKSMLNKSSGKMDLSPSLITQNEDLYIPVREGKDPTRVENLMGSDYQSMEVIDYFKDKLFAALKVPRAFLTYDDNMPGRATLSTEDQRFARTEMRVQRAIMAGYRNIINVHFASLGINPDTLDFKLKMTIPSSAMELAQMEVEMTRAQLASSYSEFVSKKWVLTKVFGMTDEEAKSVMKEKDADTKREAELENIEDENPQGDSLTADKPKSNKRLEGKIDQIRRDIKMQSRSRGSDPFALMKELKQTLGVIKNNQIRNERSGDERLNKIIRSIQENSTELNY